MPQFEYLTILPIAGFTEKPGTRELSVFSMSDDLSLWTTLANLTHLVIGIGRNDHASVMGYYQEAFSSLGVPMHPIDKADISGIQSSMVGTVAFGRSQYHVMVNMNFLFDKVPELPYKRKSVMWSKVRAPAYDVLRNAFISHLAPMTVADIRAASTVVSSDDLSGLSKPFTQPELDLPLPPNPDREFKYIGEPIGFYVQDSLADEVATGNAAMYAAQRYDYYHEAISAGRFEMIGAEFVAIIAAIASVHGK